MDHHDDWHWIDGSAFASVEDMRKLIVQQWVTVDNIAAEDDGGLSFVEGAPFTDEVTPYKTSMFEFINSVDTMILGANTYNQSKDYWPNATDQGEWGEKLNSCALYVASTTLQEAPWGDWPAGTVTKDAAATIRELKEQDGKNIWLWGSLSLMHDLIGDGLVDEVRLLVCAATRGSGTRVFEDRQDLELIEATGFDNGVALMRYGLKA